MLSYPVAASSVNWYLERLKQVTARDFQMKSEAGAENFEQ